MLLLLLAVVFVAIVVIGFVKHRNANLVPDEITRDEEDKIAKLAKGLGASIVRGPGKIEYETSDSPEDQNGVRMSEEQGDFRAPQEEAATGGIEAPEGSETSEEGQVEGPRFARPASQQPKERSRPIPQSKNPDELLVWKKWNKQ